VRAFETASRYWHTLRYLRAEQVWGRLWFRIGRPTPDLRPAPRRRTRAGPWVAPIGRKPEFTPPDRLDLLNQSWTVATAASWDDPRLDKLRRYQLHYFGHLSAEPPADDASQRALMTRWVRENLPGRGTGWEPYPTSLRIVNWIKWALAGHELPPECAHSLAVQARWLSRRIETHLLANHLAVNGKALVFAGAFFDGPEAATFSGLGLAILARELPEQILPDGGHFERSPMYHASMLEDALDLCNLGTAFGLSDTSIVTLPARIARMRRWLAAMTHPDGEIAFFNDAAFGSAPSPAALDAYARRLGFGELPPPDPATHLAESGYVRLAAGPAVVLVDVAPVGPDYQPGHAHADTLSFELSLHGTRLLVNSGTSEYGVSTERHRQRGTAAHNTVVVDGRDSSEVWSGFRVARRAHPVGLSLDAGARRLRCSHDGYAWLPGRPRHTRVLQLDAGEVVVEDTVDGPHATAEARFHLHPSVRATGDSAGVALRVDDRPRARLSAEPGRVRLEPSTWHPEFGRSDPATCVVVALDGGKAVTRIRWSGE
jgi:uncharacterized heparinase superfamily protein